VVERAVRIDQDLLAFAMDAFEVRHEVFEV